MYDVNIVSLLVLCVHPLCCKDVLSCSVVSSTDLSSLLTLISERPFSTQIINLVSLYFLCYFYGFCLTFKYLTHFTVVFKAKLIIIYVMIPTQLIDEAPLPLLRCLDVLSITVSAAYEQGHWSWAAVNSGPCSVTHWLWDLEQVNVSGLCFLMCKVGSIRVCDPQGCWGCRTCKAVGKHRHDYYFLAIPPHTSAGACAWALPALPQAAPFTCP